MSSLLGSRVKPHQSHQGKTKPATLCIFSVHVPRVSTINLSVCLSVCLCQPDRANINRTCFIRFRFDEKNMTPEKNETHRAPGVERMSGRSSFVRTKCPIKLMPKTVSSPSDVTALPRLIAIAAVNERARACSTWGRAKRDQA